MGADQASDGIPLARLIGALARPQAYSNGVEEVEVHQTHISVVFLAGGFAYKLKKPVALEFVDYSTPERRRHFCEEEVRLNGRLAPGVYLGVVPVTRDGAGRLAIGGAGDVVDWVVKMRRLAPESTFAARLAAGRLGVEDVRKLARRMASFHRQAEGGDRVAAHARFEAVERNALENFERGAPEGLCVRVYDRVRELTAAALAALRPLIESRAERGVARETHGDLRLDHVYHAPGSSPEGLLIVDCIEFSERFRHADPVAELAFPVMDLTAGGRRDLACRLADAYIEATGDEEARELLPFYVAYRAAVRAKVEGIKAAEPEVSDAERAEARARACAYWMVALGALEAPSRRPCLVLIGGLPGAGKSTLARGLAARGDFAVVRSDEVRKALASTTGAVAGPPPGGFERGIYSSEWTDRTYAECLRLASGVAAGGGRVIVDASFREESRRATFLAAARRLGVPAVLLICRADAATTRRRLLARQGTGDASDADWAVYEEAAARWEPPGPAVAPHAHAIDTAGSVEEGLDLAWAVLADEGLVGPPS